MLLKCTSAAISIQKVFGAPILQRGDLTYHTLLIEIYIIIFIVGFKYRPNFHGFKTGCNTMLIKSQRQGSTVCSDQWKAYYNIQRDLGLQHLTVNHSLHFVDAITGVHTQHIESYWNTKKTYIKAMKGCRRTHLEGYLNEFMWRDRFNDNAFYNLCSHIAMQYT